MRFGDAPCHLWAHRLTQISAEEPPILSCWNHDVRRSLFFALTALALAGCARTPPFTAGPHLTLAQGTELPPPSNVDPDTGRFDYRIGPFDKLRITVFGVEDLSQEVQVDGSGRIGFPLVGQVVAQGKTPGELAQDIEAGLRRGYIRKPQVTVNLGEMVSQVITVDGQVREPGQYPVTAPLTLMRAVARAKGTTELARLHDVVVFRTVGDREMAALYNLEAIRRGVYPDPPVYPADVVVVGDSPARRMFQTLTQAGGLLAAPVIAILQRI